MPAPYRSHYCSLEKIATNIEASIFTPSRRNSCLLPDCICFDMMDGGSEHSAPSTNTISIRYYLSNSVGIEDDVRPHETFPSRRFVLRRRKDFVFVIPQCPCGNLAVFSFFICFESADVLFLKMKGEFRNGTPSSQVYARTVLVCGCKWCRLPSCISIFFF